MSSSSTDNGKTVAILSYLTLIGWIIAIVMNNNSKTELGSFHLRQSLGLFVLALGLTILARFLGVSWGAQIVQLGLFVLWVIGFIGAIQGEKKEVPFLGAQFQDWFKGIG